LILATCTGAEGKGSGGDDTAQGSEEENFASLLFKCDEEQVSEGIALPDFSVDEFLRNIKRRELAADPEFFGIGPEDCFLLGAV